MGTLPALRLPSRWVVTRLVQMEPGVLYWARWDRQCATCGFYILKGDAFVALSATTGRHYWPSCDGTARVRPEAESEPSRGPQTRL